MPVTKRVYSKRDHMSFDGSRWLDEDGFPITGIKRTYYPNGVVMDETNLVDGVNDGVQRVYDFTGHLWYENYWKSENIVRFKKFA